MIIPALNELCEKVDCRYSLVSIISKRSRQIVEESTKSGESLDGKAVSLAVDDLMKDHITYTRRENVTDK